MAQRRGVWGRHLFYTVEYLRFSCGSRMLDMSLAFSGLNFPICLTEGWAVHWKVPSCSDFPLSPYVILDRLAADSEVKAQCVTLGKSLDCDVIVTRISLTGEAGQPH